jgi:uncharacterized protein YuzE
MAQQIELTLKWDAESDAGYIATGEGRPGQGVARTIPILDAASQMYGAIDLSEGGVLLGIEILGVSNLLPAATDSH